MRMPAFPRPALLPWLLAAASVVLLVLGIVNGDGVLTTMGVAGIAVGLLAYPAAKLLLGPPPEFDEQPHRQVEEELDPEDADGNGAEPPRP